MAPESNHHRQPEQGVRALKRIAYIVHRMGPYHHARLRAAAGVLDVHAIELAAESDTYAWARVEEAGGYSRVTLSVDAPADAVCARIEESRPDVVAVPGWSRPQALHALAHCLGRGIPTVLLSESQARDSSRRPLAEWVKSWVVHSADAALVGGRSHAAYLHRLGMPAGRIAMGYDAVDNTYYQAESARARCDAAQWRSRLSLPDRYVLACARMVPQKNLPVLMEAFAILKRRGMSGVSLVIVGDGPERPRIEAGVRRLGLVGSVHLAGFRQIDELPAYYALADAFVLPSIVEPWGLVVNEAMACGLPVIVSRRAGCARELVRESNGRLVDPTTPAQMADALAEVLLDPALRARMGASSLRGVARWGTDRFARGLLHAAEAACGAHRGPRPLRARGIGLLAAARAVRS